LALFITEVNDKLISDFGGEKRKVVVIGGSYPGALSAWFKAKYPNIADASWASSAVVNAIKDFDMFDYQIYNSTVRSSETCAQTVQNMTIMFDTYLENGSREEADKIKGAFNATHLHDGDFAFYLADMFVLSVQYGGRTALCEFLDSLADKDMDEHFLLTAEYVKDVGSPSEYDRNALKNITIVPESPMRQWTYQYCTEFGFFQTPYSYIQMRSELLTLDYWTELCQSIFGNHIQTRANESNVQYGGANIMSTNTYFINGGEDPWQWAGVIEAQPDLNNNADLLQCENCGHCVELYNEKDSDSEELKQTRENIKQWLSKILSNKALDQIHKTEVY
jgi:pimeloyl-ACP methyl ester carboxylesterase